MTPKSNPLRGAAGKKRERRNFLSRNPQAINDDNWYYEGRRAILVISWHPPSTERDCSRIEIPWKVLEQSFVRYQKTKAAYKAKKKGAP